MWMTNPADGAVAQVDDVDQWRLRGWQSADEPTGNTLVWVHNESTGGRAQLPANVLPRWESLGWKPGSPPEPVDLTRDQRLVDPAAEPQSDSAEPATSGPTDRPARASRPTRNRE